MTHICEVCCQPAQNHEERCDHDDIEHRHFPALCCPGCPCGSFEEAHPPVEVTT